MYYAMGNHGEMVAPGELPALMETCGMGWGELRWI